MNKVDISVNGKLIDIKMKAGDAGESFFVMETEVRNLLYAFDDARNVGIF